MQEAQRAREEGERRRRERGYDRRYRDRYKDRYRRVCTIGITPFKFFMISSGYDWLFDDHPYDKSDKAYHRLGPANPLIFEEILVFCD